jgi:lipopolysaccharide transport protein LptA
MRAPSALLCLALSLAGPAAQALDADNDQPTLAQADRIEVNQQTGVITYRGHVSFVKGGISIQADKIEVRQRGEALHSVSATGAPVRFHQRGLGPRDEIRGVAARVDYSADSREVALHGQVHLEQHGDVLEAATVHYQLDGSGFRAEGGGQGRVQAVLAPRRRGQTGSAP